MAIRISRRPSANAHAAIRSGRGPIRSTARCAADAGVHAPAARRTPPGGRRSSTVRRPSWVPRTISSVGASSEAVVGLVERAPRRPAPRRGAPARARQTARRLPTARRRRRERGAPRRGWRTPRSADSATRAASSSSPVSITIVRRPSARRHAECPRAGAHGAGDDRSDGPACRRTCPRPRPSRPLVDAAGRTAVALRCRGRRRPARGPRVQGHDSSSSSAYGVS